MDVLKIVAKRLGWGAVTLLVVSILIFSAVELLPGDLAQAVLGQGATEENLAAMRKQLGLDRAAPLRYLEWLRGAVVADFGDSLITKAPVIDSIGPRFKNTLFLAAYAAVIAVPIAIFLGVLVALFRNTIFDRVANVHLVSRILSRLHPDSVSGCENRLLPGDRQAQRRHDFRRKVGAHVPAGTNDGTRGCRSHDAYDARGNH